MENNTPKKLTKAAAIVSLAAALAATPISAGGFVNATEDYAQAGGYGAPARARVELSFANTGVSQDDQDNDQDGITYAELHAEHYYQYGETVSTAATAWAYGKMIGNERWVRS